MTETRPRRAGAPLPVLHLVALLLLGLVPLAGAGCARDTDTLICAPGREAVGGACIDLVDEPDVYCVLDTSTAALSDVGGGVDETCTAWSDCAAGLICIVPGPEGIGRCTPRCDEPTGEPCAEDAVCSAAGLCLSPGPLLEGDLCSGGERCAEGLACAREDGRCHLVCDPRSAQPDTCGVQGVCVPRASGLGLCIQPCQ